MKPSAGQGLYALMLNRKGRILTDMRLFLSEDETALDLEPSVTDVTAERMNDFKLSYKVDIKKDEGRAVFHLCGAEAAGCVSHITGADAGAMNPFDHRDCPEIDARAARTDRLGVTGFDIDTPGANAGEVRKLFEKGGAAFAGADVFEAVRIEAVIPVYGKDMDESTIAPEAGLENAVSFEKGCYVGQEVVARTHWRGRVNRHLAGFVFEGDPPPGGSEIFSDGSAAGRVTSSGFSPRLGAVAMGYIRREYAAAGTEILTSGGQRGKVV